MKLNMRIEEKKRDSKIVTSRCLYYLFIGTLFMSSLSGDEIIDHERIECFYVSVSSPQELRDLTVFSFFGVQTDKTMVFYVFNAKSETEIEFVDVYLEPSPNDPAITYMIYFAYNNKIEKLLQMDESQFCIDLGTSNIGTEERHED